MHNNDPKAETTEFKGRRTLVTGGTKGIGAAIVDRLIRGGADVIAAARSISPGTPDDRFIQADVSTREGIETVVKAVTHRFKGLDILIHNVGGSAARGGGALVLSDEDWQAAFDTNLFAAVRLIAPFCPRCWNKDQA
jgi:NAD(P)-dependent dehydrogenase (short-subunit alcohol dehydrogenase family)